MSNQDSRLAILPVYLVLDTSYSMQDEGKFNAALSFLPRLLSCMTGSSSISDKIRVEVITFDEDAKVVLPLGGIDEVEEWIIRNKETPIVPHSDSTYYGKAFEILRTEIQVGVRQIQSQTLGNVNFNAYRPVVFFITDGEPNDELSDRGNAFTQLTDKNFEYRPNLICVGVGDIKREDLVEYGAGRYKSPTGSYITGNESLVIIPKDGTLPAQALGAIVSTLVASIVQSFGNAANVGDSGGVPDLFGPHDDLFDNIDWGEDE